MTENPKAIFSSSEGERNMRKQKISSPLGVTSLIMAILAMLVSFGGAELNHALEAQKAPDRQYAGGDASFVTDKTGNVLTFGGQVVVFLVANAVSLTLASVSIIIGFIALSQDGSNLALAGILISTLSIMWAFW